MGALMLTVLVGACGPEPPEPIDFSTLSVEQQRRPENALAAMQTAPGVEVGLFAAEPLLTNPTNMAIDARGRIWICEANNYRLPYNPKFSERLEGDRILILEDTDGDGQADNTKVFYQGPEINAALGIAVLGNRVIVSHSPYVFVFTDADGDDRPERQDTLFTGIDGPDDDHGTHAFVFGPDGRYYFNFGNGGHQLMDRRGEPVVDQLGRPINNQGKPYRQGMAFRWDPDSSFVEVLGHNFRNNYELTVDPFGVVWQSDNDDDGNRGTRINFVMEYGNYGYTDELTGAGWRTRRPGMHEEIPKRHWHLNDPGVVPNLLQTGAGSPAGITFYTGTLLPAAFQNQLLHAEALQNVIRAYPARRAGAGYAAEMVELLKSQDQWFRPADVTTAPDGSVFVADWYDPGVGGNKMDDIDRGRIYRLAPDVTSYEVPAFDLSTPEGAVAALHNPNMDVFYQAWTRLRDWGPAAEAALLKSWQSDDPYRAARALWLLARLPGKTGAYIAEAMQHADPDIRITGLRVARQLDAANLLGYLAGAVEDGDPGVRREAAIALRHEGSERASHLWAALAAQYDGDDRWYLEALGIGADLYPAARFAAWQARAGDDWNTPAGRRLIWRLRAEPTTALLTGLIRDPQVDSAWLPHYFRAFHFKPEKGRDAALASLVDIDHPLADQIRVYALGQISADYVRRNGAFRAKVRRMLPGITGTPEWLAAIKSMQLREQAPQLLDYLLRGEDPALANEAGHLLLEFNGEQLLNQHLQGLDELEQKALYAQLGRVQHPDAVQLLARQLEQPALSFPVQVQLVESLGNSWDGQHLLYDKLRAGKLNGDLKNTAALKLMGCWNPEIRQAAPTYLSSAEGKGGVLPPIEELTDQQGNAAAGRIVFSQFCQSCHQVDGEGTEFGPDLSAIGAKLAKSAIYSSILYPSSGINFGYEGYTVKLHDGTQLSGIITSETEDQLTLKIASGLSTTYDRSDVQSVEAMDQSLMTANLQAVMSERDLVNLVEYLAGLKEGGMQ